MGVMKRKIGDAPRRECRTDVTQRQRRQRVLGVIPSLRVGLGGMSCRSQGQGACKAPTGEW